LLPMVTLPKFTLVGLAAICPTWRAFPLPPRCSPCGEFESLAVTEIFPLEAPVDVGAKLTVNEALAPAARVSGTASPIMLYAGSLTVACEIVAAAFPLLVIETVCVEVLPTVTSPKSTAVGLSTREAVGGGDATGGCDTKAPVLPQPMLSTAAIAAMTAVQLRTTCELPTRTTSSHLR